MGPSLLRTWRGHFPAYVESAPDFAGEPDGIRTHDLLIKSKHRVRAMGRRLSPFAASFLVILLTL
jgi:hypothetical protein